MHVIEATKRFFLQVKGCFYCIEAAKAYSIGNCPRHTTPFLYIPGELIYYLKTGPDLA